MKRLFVISMLLSTINVQAMTQQSFVERLKTTHPFFKQQALSSDIKLIEERATTANEDWIVGVNSNYKSEKNAKNASATYNDLNTTSVNVSGTKKHIATGSDITIKHTWAEKNKDLNTNRNQFSLDYTYPLLRNKDGINDRLSGDLARIEIAKNTLERLEAEEGFILKKLELFIDLAYAQAQQLINQRRLALTKKELTIVKKKYAASVVDKVDVLLQEDAHQKAKQQLLQAQQALTLLRHQIGITLDLDFEQTVAEIDLYKTYNPKIIDLRAYLAKNSRILKINHLAKKILKRQLLSFKNQSKAKLDLNLNLSSAGESNSYSSSLNNQGATWKVGLGLSYPLGGIKSDSNIQKASVQLESLNQSKQEQLLDIYTQAKTLKENIQLLKGILTSNKIQIEIAKARTVEEKQRYTNGNGQASFVINAQNNEQIVELNYAQVARNYQKAALQFRAVIDQLAQ